MSKLQSLVKKCIAPVLAAALIFPGATASAAVSFSDVNAQQNGWAASSIYLMAEKQILTGYPDGTFRPGYTITKAEWTKMVYQLFDEYRPNLYATGLSKINGYVDVPQHHWAYQQISELYDNSFQWGVYGLNPNGMLTFRPDTQLNRLQLANMLYSFFDTRLIDRRLSENDVCTVVSSFKDIPVKIFSNEADYNAAVRDDGRLDSATLQISTINGALPSLFMGTGVNDCRFGTDGFSNAQASILASLEASGIMTATQDRYFRPLDKVTRAEAVTILNRMYNYLKNNFWLQDYSTINLDQAGTGGTGSGGYGNGTVTDPWSASSGNATSNQTAANIRDYFKTAGPKSDSGVITKNIRKSGEIETAVLPRGGYSYLTIELVSQDKNDLVDLIISADGKGTVVPQESFPMTISVSGVQEVGLHTRLRDTNPLKKGGNVTLTVRLSNTAP